MSHNGDPRAGSTLLVGLIGTILLLAVVVLAQVLFYNVQQMEDQTKLYAPRPQALLQAQAEQLAQINTYRYVNQKDGIVAIPIDRAIELYVAEMKSAGHSATMGRPTNGPKAPEQKNTP